jgi:ABC-type transporter lipoprotein component MlaA
MKKNNPLFCAVLFYLFLNLCNVAFATENINIDLKNKYPDYSCAFSGKDTCESFNRKIFLFNSEVNKYIIRPANIIWASVMPKYGMDKLQNFYTNLEYPIRLVSCLLQKDFHSSKTETVRFLTNTTIGLGGLYDPAKNKFKIEPREEDMGQVLAHYHVKKGPYLVLPVVASGNIRDLGGKALDLPLNPSSYIIGPVVGLAKSVFLLNKTAQVQPLIKSIDYTYADPYEITKTLHGVERYIKNNNLDRKEVLAEKSIPQNIIEVKNTTSTQNHDLTLKSDIHLNDYNPQSSKIDSLRTALFETKSSKKSIWSELSVWNRNFDKKLKISSVNIEKKHPDYKYRYILQKNKTSPLAILYPSFGEGIMSHHSAVLAQMLYDKGYSVLILGSTFQWEFAKSMPNSYKPGFPDLDSYYARIVTAKILDTFKKEKDYNFNKKILIGTSFGGLITLFTAAKEQEENKLGISDYISINPPVEVLFALKQLDKFSQDWKNNSEDIKLRLAVTAQKILQISQNLKDEDFKKGCNILPFSDEEAKLIIGFIMKQKLSDLVFTIENCTKAKKNKLADKIKNLNFNDYAQKYLLINEYISQEKLNYDTSLYSLKNFLQIGKNYKIYHSIDDYYTNQTQLSWLKEQTKDKSVFFSNGSHLGFLYRKEFLAKLEKDIELEEVNSNEIPIQSVNNKKRGLKFIKLHLKYKK